MARALYAQKLFNVGKNQSTWKIPRGSKRKISFSLVVIRNKEFRSFIVIHFENK